MSIVTKSIRSKIDNLLEPIVGSYKCNEDGSISTSRFNIRFYESALIQLLDLSDTGLQPSDFERCAWAALRSTIRLKCTKSIEFERELSREIDSFKRKRRVRFRLCTRCYFSLPPDYELNVKVGSSNLIISQSRPKLSPDQPKISEVRKAFEEPEFGSWLTITVYERTKGGALDQASKEIEFIFGVLNFSINLGTLTSYFGKRDIRAKLFPGREIFIVDDKGVADTEVWRYYTVTPNRTQILQDSDIKKLDNHTRILDKLKNMKPGDRSFYEEFFRLYFDTLSEIDHESMVLRLWKAAEHLTMIQSAAHIASRLAITWEDKEAVSAVCYALGYRRNWITHNPKPSLNVDELPEMFRRFLEHSAWCSLTIDIKSVAHWRAILEMSDMNIDPHIAEDALKVLRRLS